MDQHVAKGTTIFVPTRDKRDSHRWLWRASRATLGLGIATVYGVTVCLAQSLAHSISELLLEPDLDVLHRYDDIMI